MLKKVSSALAVGAMLLSPGVVLASPSAAGSAFDHSFTSIDGSELPLSDFRGKVLLVVNTASLCGFTRQYEGLQALYKRYEPKGLVVVGVPSNDFGGQEPKAEAEIAKFCQGAFGVTFPLTSKVTVAAGEPHPFYRWTKSVLGDAGQPKWNFFKYLIGRDGRLVASFSSAVDLQSDKLVAAVEAELEKPAEPAN